MSKRVCSIHGVWEKSDSVTRCPKCSKSYQSNYNNFHRNKDSEKFYKSKDWLNIREIVLSSEPICIKCGRHETEHIDHIIPVDKGGRKKSLDNLQGLCKSCHTRKTNTEHILHRPHWMPAPKIDVVMICGSSGAGKSFIVNRDRTNRTLVIDLDVIKASMSGCEIHSEESRALLDRALFERNRILANLAKERFVRDYDVVFFILSAPKRSTREWWAKVLNAKVIMLLAPMSVCKRRIQLDETRRNRIKYYNIIIDSWFSDYTKSSMDIEVNTEGVVKSLQFYYSRTSAIPKLSQKLFSGGTIG